MSDSCRCLLPGVHGDVRRWLAGERTFSSRLVPPATQPPESGLFQPSVAAALFDWQDFLPFVPGSIPISSGSQLIGLSAERHISSNVRGVWRTDGWGSFFCGVILDESAKSCAVFPCVTGGGDKGNKSVTVVFLTAAQHLWQVAAATFIIATLPPKHSVMFFSFHFFYA